MTSLNLLQRRVALASNRGRVWLGSMGAAGLLLVALAIGALVWTPKLARDAVELRDQYQLESTRQQDRASERESDPATAASDFHDALPHAGQNLEDLREIFHIAREQHLQLARGDYVTSRRSDSGLASCEIVLPLHADYASLRAFIAAVLNALPNASLVELRLERAGNRQLNARVHLALYYRET
jgi:hypothetical protein